MGRTWIVRGLRAILHLYFREVEVTGACPGKDTRGCLFAANHVNGLIDPLLVLTTAPCDIAPIGKSTLWKIPVLSWLLDAVGAVPISRRKDAPDKSRNDNDAVFGKVAEHFSRGGNVLIFPEGTSHNEPHLVPLRTGGARMLERAARGGAHALLFQAVGLEFDARDAFRSRALVLYGPVREVLSLPCEGEERIQAVTDTLRRDLSDLVLEGETWRERHALVVVSSILAADRAKENGAEPTLASSREVAVQVRDARRLLATVDRELCDDLVAGAAAYADALSDNDVSDTLVAFRGAPPKRSSVWLAIADLPLALVGALGFLVPYLAIRLLATLLAKRSDDVLSTYKVIGGVIVYPAWFLLVAGALFWFGGWCVGGLLTLILVSTIPSTVRWLDRFDRRKFFFSRSDRLRLEVQRDALVRLVQEARSKLPTAEGGGA